MRIISFVKEKLRPGSSYQLVEWNQLHHAEQEMLAGLYDEKEVYGLFKPKSSYPHLTQKVAYKEVVLLYLHLEKSNNLPRYLFYAIEEKLNETIAQLIFDGIFEIEYHGDFVSGTAAIKAIFEETIFEDSAIPDKLSRLSIEAIRYGLLARDLDSHSLSRRLYSFNTIPSDPSQNKKFGADDACRKFVYSALSIEFNRLLEEQWKSSDFSAEKYWLSWWRNKQTENDLVATEKSTFKLYISPLFQDLPKVFNLAIPALSGSGAFSFKVGNTIQGLHRPDKMVVYFDNKNELMRAATSLKEVLGGFAAQGVPFTSQLDEAGILSWGIDPPESDVLSVIESGSWRMKVTDQLALAIIQAQNDSLNFQDSIHFIRAKLKSVGINTADWTTVNHSMEFSS